MPVAFPTVLATAIAVQGNCPLKANVILIVTALIVTCTFTVGFRSWLYVKVVGS